MRNFIFILRILFKLIPALWKNLDKKYCDVSLFYCNDDESYKKYMALKKQIIQIIDPLYGIKFKTTYENKAI